MVVTLSSLATGASLTLPTTKVKVELTVPPLPSLAVTVIVIGLVVTSALLGVPLNVRVPALKLNQLGIPEADNVNTSSESTSAKAPDGST